MFSCVQYVFNVGAFNGKTMVGNAGGLNKENSAYLKS